MNENVAVVGDVTINRTHYKIITASWLDSKIDDMVTPPTLNFAKHDQQQLSGIITTLYPFAIETEAAASRACQFPAALIMPDSEVVIMISGKFETPISLGGGIISPVWLPVESEHRQIPHERKFVISLRLLKVARTSRSAIH